MSNTRLQHTSSQVIAALKGSSGIKQEVANRLGVHRHTIDRYLERYPQARQAYDDELERENDYNESVINWQLHEMRVVGTDKDGNPIREPTAAAVDIARWRAPRKMKERGYTDTILVDVDPKTLTLEQLERIHNGEDPMSVIASAIPVAPVAPDKPKRKATKHKATNGNGKS